MTFPFQPVGGPDSVGGLFPARFPAVKCRNRSGTTLIRGEVVQLALTPGIATEAASNDSNSYVPGGSNDTVWNTVVLPVTSSLGQPQSGIITGGIFGVVTSTSVADNGVVDVVFGGLVDAFVICAEADGAIPGQPLTVTTAKNFDGVISSNEVLVGFYLSPTDTTLTNRELKKVWLTNGLGLARNHATAASAIG
jgi:hypothetical protein